MITPDNALLNIDPRPSYASLSASHEYQVPIDYQEYADIELLPMVHPSDRHNEQRCIHPACMRDVTRLSLMGLGSGMMIITAGAWYAVIENALCPEIKNGLAEDIIMVGAKIMGSSVAFLGMRLLAKQFCNQTGE